MCRVADVAEAAGEASAYALITGASRGLGAAFAAALAAQGLRLVLTARSEPDLAAVRERLLRRHPAGEIHCLPADLSRGGAAAVLEELASRRLPVELLVNNAGLGSGGEFAARPLGREQEQVAVNIAALVTLTHGCLAGMRERRRGAIIQVASVAAFQAVPYLATYAATKAFVLHFSLALHEELRAEGIQVLALCPGPTETDFFRAAGIAPRGPMQSPEAVVRLALAGLQRRQAVVVCGAANRVMVAAERLLPRTVLTKLVARMMKG